MATIIRCSRLRKECRRTLQGWKSQQWIHGKKEGFFPLGTLQLDGQVAWYGAFVAEGEAITKWKD